MTQQQTYRNHARYVPLYHFVFYPILGVLLVWSGIRVIAHFGGATLFEFLLVLALGLAAFLARSFALAAQDRVIRLEMKLRMQAVAPELMPRFAEFASAQLTALRFAGDSELPVLAQQVLDGTLTRNGDIKRQIKEWRADTERV